MSKSIASRTFEIAKAQHKKQIEEVKEQFLDIMRKRFAMRLENCDFWPTEDSRYLRMGEDLNIFEPVTLKAACEDLGFELKREETPYTSVEPHYLITVPEHVKGQKRTPAQLMVYKLNIEINKSIRCQKQEARKACKEVLEKIKLGEFKSVQCSEGNAYNIEVTLIGNYENTREFSKEAQRIFSKKNFNLWGINDVTGVWNLRVYDNK